MPAPEEENRSSAVRVALMDDYEVVVAGLHSMLAPFADRVHVVELVSQLPVASRVDVVLYDAFSRERVVGPVEDMLRDTDAKVVVYSWHAGVRPRGRGAHEGRVGLALEVPVRGRPGVVTRAGVPGRGRGQRGPRPGRTPRRGRLARQGARSQPAGGRGAGADRAGAEQPGDRGPGLHQHQLGQDLHPYGLPQDRRRAPDPGSPVGDRGTGSCPHASASWSTTPSRSAATSGAWPWVSTRVGWVRRALGRPASPAAARASARPRPRRRGAW